MLINDKLLEYIKKHGVNEKPPPIRWIAKERKQGIDMLGTIPMVIPKQEKWRFTDLRKFLNKRLNPEPFDSFRLLNLTSPDKEKLLSIIDYENTVPVVFINGIYDASLSGISQINSGIKISGIEDKRSRFPVNSGSPEFLIFEDDDPFLQLNKALTGRGAFIEFESGFKNRNPIHFIYFYTTSFESAISCLRNSISIGKDAEVSILETTITPSDFFFTDNSVREISIGEGSKVEHIQSSPESNEAFIFNHTGFVLKKNSRLLTAAINSCGVISRNNLSIILEEDGSEVISTGFTGLKGTQQVDNYSIIDHSVSNTKSNQLYKSILSEKSKSVFRGCVKVRKDVTDADAYQLNRNILLDKTARAHSMPWLEIDSGNIKCMHGAATGTLNQDQLNYLEFRGIQHERAKKILLRAFAYEITGKLSNNSLKGKAEVLLSGIIDGVLGDSG